MLVEKNQDWAKHAGALAISCGKKTFTHSGAPNRFGIHDVGTSFGQLSLQAVALGLHVHGMGGFDAARTRTEFAIPDDFEVGAAFAIGYVDGDGAPPASRKRKPLSEIVFSGRIGVKPAPFWASDSQPDTALYSRGPETAPQACETPQSVSGSLTRSDGPGCMRRQPPRPGSPYGLRNVFCPIPKAESPPLARRAFHAPCFTRVFDWENHFRRLLHRQKLCDWILRCPTIFRQAEKNPPNLHNVSQGIPACCESCGFSVEIIAGSCIADSRRPAKSLQFIPIRRLTVFPDKCREIISSHLRNGSGLAPARTGSRRKPAPKRGRKR